MVAFDHTTATIFIRRAGKSSQDIYKDEQGNLCLNSRSKLSGGGAAVSVAALEVLRSADAPAKFVRVINEESGLNAIVSLSRLDGLSPIQGKYGAYVAVDQFDLDTATGGDDFGEPSASYY